MDLTIHSTFLPHDDADAALAFYRDTLGFEVRNDVAYGGMRWITVGPVGRPDTSIVLTPPAVDPGITDDERRTVVDMMAKGTYGHIILGTSDLDGTFERLRAAAPTSSRSRPSSRMVCATARSAIPRATSSASTSSAEPSTGPGRRVRPRPPRRVRPARGHRHRSGEPDRNGRCRGPAPPRSHCRTVGRRAVAATVPVRQETAWNETRARRAGETQTDAGKRRPRRRPRPTDGDTKSMPTKKDAQSPAPHAADTHDLIRVHGARVNNLKDVSVEIPKRRLTVFTGVSGSGKSSLVFGTLAAESQRMINETYSAFVQGFMPTQARPEVDVLEGLTTAIIVDQQRLGSDPRSTVGTATDANAMLRILFSRLGKPHIGSPKAFSFNVASISGAGAVTMERAGRTVKERRDFQIIGGMCPRCEGRGTVSDIDLTQLYDDSKSLAEGAFTIPGWKSDSFWTVRVYAESGLLDPDKPIREFTKREMQDFLHKEPVKVKVEGVNLTYEGLIPKIQKSFLSKDREAMQPHIRAFVDRAVTFTTCPECDGTRLGEAARSSKIAGISIADACAMQISDLAEWVRGLDEPSVAPLLTTLLGTLDSFVEIGLGYLSLDRSAGTLSGGEAQRVKMIRHLGSSLTDVTYVFDEPTIGLHPHDIQRMNDLLLRLRDKGNTVLVVEHKPETIVIADHVVDLGPGAGTGGGTVCFEGTVEGLRAGDTVTGRHFDDRAAPKEEVRKATGTLEIRGAATHNLRDVDVDIPLGVLVVVTGVAGSGKSSLVHGSIPAGEGVVSIDQAAIRGSRRSNPATYTGLLDPIRKAFAKANGVKPRCSAPTPRVPVPPATVPESSTPTWR